MQKQSNVTDDVYGGRGRVELSIYVFIIAIAVIRAVPALLSISSPENPNYEEYSWALSKGWLLGERMMDNSDAQWRSFRNSLPMAILLMVANFLANSAIRRYSPPAWQWRLRTIVCLMGTFLLHGFNMIKVVGLLSLSFAIGMTAGDSIFNPILTWSFAIGTLFFLEYAKTAHTSVFFQISHALGKVPIWHGFQPRWGVTFNISVLRMISYNMDYFFAKRNSFCLTRHIDNCSECQRTTICDDFVCSRVRVQRPPPREAFSLEPFLAYCLYLPTYFAGPIITFNDFVSQINRPIMQTWRSIALYAVRWVACLVCMEFLMHIAHVTAIKDNQAWLGLSPMALVLIAFFNLKMIWLKLLLIWRFFRLAAMVDGIVPLENMVRCMSNNYSAQSFWRSWHRSFNQWIIRYIYIPLGGSAYSAVTIWPIFTFVAIWHDISLNLLTWSWLICLFILPEVILGWADRQFGWPKRIPGYRQWWALLAAVNCFIMATANTVGFVAGVNGTEILLATFRSREGLLFAPIMMTVIYAAVNLMFEIRHRERIRGIFHNY